jgi:outer membrane protein assembly factor BamE (lipoprotein component of BamABCDE complex)
MKRIQPLNTKHTVIAACLALSLAACSPKIDNEGYISETPLKEQVTVGKTTRDQVKDTFGSPSSQSTFGDETWYYITDRKEGYAFLKPDIVQQNVTSITFDNAGIVTKIENYTKKDAEDITLVKRTTPTEGHTLGFFEQLLGNVGRFNQPGTGTDSAAPGRKASGGL